MWVSQALFDLLHDNSFWHYKPPSTVSLLFLHKPSAFRLNRIYDPLSHSSPGCNTLSSGCNSLTFVIFCFISKNYLQISLQKIESCKIRRGKNQHLNQKYLQFVARMIIGAPPAATHDVIVSWFTTNVYHLFGKHTANALIVLCGLFLRAHCSFKLWKNEKPGNSQIPSFVRAVKLPYNLLSYVIHIHRN